MKIAIASIISTLALAACGGAPPNERLLTQACMDLFKGDADITQAMTSDIPGLTVDSYCSCYASIAITDPATVSLHKDVLSAINTTRSETGLGVEDAVKQVELTMTNDGAYDTFTTEQLDQVGDYFQNITERMRPDGQCPA